MSIKVFISHKKEDSSNAAQIARYLEIHDEVSCYVDVLDSTLFSYGGDDLGEYFRDKLGECTHLMAVVSENTKLSWWVPFEIGIASEKQYPISTFAIQYTDLPQYLKKWPYLRNETDLDKYIRVALTTRPHILVEGLEKIAASRRGSYTRLFHENLKKALGQADEY
ncbi:toll/interleukin-1 receptor domain-containing protein [candidate division NPL-UPA2 bacterium]|nr:toll/interleukin-1 receptor domain-containing protein [candidate division NPL-UPA2 bacterium]